MFGCLAAKVFVEALRRTGDQPTRAGLLAEIKKISNYDSGISGPVTFGADRPMGLSAIYPVVVEKGSVKVLSDPIPVQ